MRQTTKNNQVMPEPTSPVLTERGQPAKTRLTIDRNSGDELSEKVEPVIVFSEEREFTIED